MRSMQQFTPNFFPNQQKVYKIIQLLGEGSYGKVSLAESNGDEQKYAIKEQIQISEQEWMLCQFMVNKKFKNLVNLFAIEQQNDGKFILVMEYCPLSLFTKMSSQIIEPFELRFIMKEIAYGIKELHDLGYAHRNIKPENILIQLIPLGSGQVQERYKLRDFMTVQPKDRLETKKVGTYYYLAPELLEGNQNYTQKVDIWSFGALCFELLTKKPLFYGITAQEIEYKIRNLNIDREIDNLKNMERHHTDLFKKMLQRNPDNRCDINYVIANLGETIRTKSINKVDPKIIIQKQNQNSLTIQEIIKNNKPKFIPQNQFIIIPPKTKIQNFTQQNLFNQENKKDLNLPQNLGGINKAGQFLPPKFIPKNKIQPNKDMMWSPPFQHQRGRAQDQDIGNNIGIQKFPLNPPKENQISKPNLQPNQGQKFNFQQK